MSDSIAILSYNVRGLKDMKKRLAVYDFLKTKKIDVILLQETHCHLKQEEYRWGREWGGVSLWSKGTGNSKGVAILFKKCLNFEMLKYECDPNGRYVCCQVKFNENVYTILSLYAPNIEYERLRFFNGLNALFSDENEYICGGDFNCVLDNKVDRLNCRSNIDVGQIDLKYLMNNLCLEDIWRRRNPYSQTFSWEGRGKMSRIDYFLVSQSIDNMVDKISYLEAPFSDHKAVYLKMKVNNVKVGSGLWKMNVSVLKSNLFQKAFKSMWMSWQRSKENYQDMGMWWDLGKKKIKDLTISISQLIARERNREKEVLENRLKFLKDRNMQKDEINEIQMKLRKIHEQNGVGARVRSREKWWELGEKPTRYFHNLEKRRGADKLWRGILDKEENIVFGTKQVQKRQVEFYKELFQSQNLNCNDNQYNRFLNVVDKKLSEEDRISLDSCLTMKEITKALSLMKNNKSPGPDGIVAEFYKIYWNELKHDILEVYIYSQNKRSLTYSQYLAAMILLYKKGRREDIKNWRPISLLNVDLKILSKTLAERLKTVLPKLIHTDQRGCIKGRYAGENIRLVEDIVETSDDESVILLLDQEKAFDRIEWNWIFKVLEKMNFGETFVSWLKTIYKHAKTSIITNGTQSEYFPISRGIRQGDALSALLFIIQIEPLAQKIRKSDALSGIGINFDNNSHELRLAQYVDDTCIFLCKRDFIPNCLEVIHQFEEVSGSKLNEKKTKALVHGNIEQNENFGEIILTNGPEMVLGVPIGKNNVANTFWEKLVEKLKSKLTIWSSRDLSFQGKIHIIKSIGISNLMYAFDVKHVPTNIIQEVNRALYYFLWSGKRYTINRDICCLPQDLGGLGMVNVDILVKVRRIKMVIRILQSKDSNWQLLPMSYLKCLDRDFDMDFFALRVTNCDDLIHKTNIPLYYKECILAFGEFCRKCKIVNDNENEILWCNNSLKFGGKPLAYRHWAKCGIKYISDIMENRTFRDENILEKLPNRASYFFDSHRLRSVLPECWKQRNVEVHFFDDTQTILDFEFEVDGIGRKKLKDLTSKDIYQMLILKNKCQNLSKVYWSKKFPNKEIEWSIWYDMNFKNTFLPRKVKDFNWKIFYGQVNTEMRLKKMRYSDGLCTICKRNLENLEHLLVECNYLDFVWNRIEDVVKTIDANFKIDAFVKLCGYLTDCSQGKLINLVISITRWEIWKLRNDCKYNGNEVIGKKAVETILMSIRNHASLLKDVQYNLDFINL